MAPTARTVVLFGGGILFALAPALFEPHLWSVWVAYLVAVILAMGCDALLCVPSGKIGLTLTWPKVLYIGREAGLTLTVNVPGSGRGVKIELICDLGDHLEPHGRQILETKPGREVSHHIPLISKRRGKAELQAIWLRWVGPLGLTRRSTCRPIDKRLPVLPDVQYAHGQAIQFFGFRNVVSGSKSVRFIGDGSELESLREYVAGLDHRAMDWKSSARHRKLVCREFRAERNHQIVLAIDTGRLMNEPLDGIPKLDRAIHASLALAIIALKSGDRVGLFGFDERPHVFAEPGATMRAFRRLQHLTADLIYSSGETNFTLGLTELSTRLRRRSLIIVLTDFVDTVTAELMVENLGHLARRHAVMFVTLKDPALEDWRDMPPQALEDLHRSVLASELLHERDEVLGRLRRLGIHCLEARWQDVSTRLVNRYLHIKRRELVS